MKNRTLVLGAVVVFLIAATVVTFILLDRSAKGQQKLPKKYSEVPKIISNVKTLEIVEANLREEGTTNAFVEIKIRNNSDKPIIALALESGDENNAAGNMLNGFHYGDEPPTIIIQPHETYQTDFPLANVMPGFPIRIGGVMYADETEDGDEITLKSMRRKKEHSKKHKPEVLPQ